MSREPVDNLSSPNESLVLDALHDLCAAPRTADAIPDALTYKLLRSRNTFIRERAIFLFGIKMKRRELCTEFSSQLENGECLNPPVVSALMLALYSTDCHVELGQFRRTILRILNDTETIGDIENTVLGFSLLAARKIDRNEFGHYLIRQGPPAREELAELRRLLQE